MLRGNADTKRLIDVSHLGNILGLNVCKALPGLHAFTGCDYTSAFAGQGKLRAMKLMLKEACYQELFAILGAQWKLTEETFQGLEQFTCRLYATRVNVTSVNKLRYHIFSAKRGDLNSCSLPPSQDPLKQHCLRANYVCAIWHRSLEQAPAIPSPVGHGWKTDADNKLSYVWMTCAPAPADVLKMTFCECKNECIKPSCPCASLGIACIEACKLQDCSNFHAFESANSDPPALDEDYEE